jgi:uncharacterized protein
MKWRAAVAAALLISASVGKAWAGVVLTEPLGTAGSARKPASEHLQFSPDPLPAPNTVPITPLLIQPRTDEAVRGKRVSSLIQLGLQYLHGTQAAPDLKQAGLAFMQAWSRGDAQASAAVAVCHWMGCYGTPDRRALALWIDRARARDPGKAKLLEWASAQRWNPQNPGATNALLLAAIQLQDPIALNEQALAQVTAGQQRLALRNFELAAQRGSPAALHNQRQLAQQLDSASLEPAAANASLASLAGQAQYEQAMRYHAGAGVPVNYAQALLYYRQAASMGHLQAQRMAQLMVSVRSAQGQLDDAWIRQLAPQLQGGKLSTPNAQPVAIWLQKDISFLADWRP